MNISAKAKEVLWNSERWSLAIEDEISELSNQKPSSDLLPWAVELAKLSELCCLNRSFSITASLWAFRADETKFNNLESAHRLAAELGDSKSRAKIANMITNATQSPDAALAEGFAWLDIGNLDKAVKPLLKAQSRYPNNQLLKLALSVAQCEWTNVREQIGAFQAKAESANNEEQSAGYLASFWLSKQLKEPTEKCSDLILKAHKSNPTEITLRAVEAWFGEFDSQKLVPIFESLADDSEPDLAYRFRWRGAAMLFGQPQSKGAAFELGLRTLKDAFNSKVESTPGHLALIERLSLFGKELGREDDISDLLITGLSYYSDPLDLTYLAILGAKTKSPQEKLFREILAGLAENHPMAEGVTPVQVSESPLTQLDKDDQDYDAVSVADIEIEEEISPNKKDDTKKTMLGISKDLIRPKGKAPPPIPGQKKKTVAPPTPEPELVRAERGDETRDITPLVAKEPTPKAKPKKKRKKKKRKSTLSELDDGWDITAMDLEETQAETVTSVLQQNEEPVKTQAQSKDSNVPSKKTSKFSLIPKTALDALAQRSKANHSNKNKLAGKGEQREKRYINTLDASFKNEDRTIHAQVRDISRSGLFLVTYEFLKTGSLVNLTLSLTTSKRSEKTTIAAKVVRKNDIGYGCVVEGDLKTYLQFLTHFESE